MRTLVDINKKLNHMVEGDNIPLIMEQYPGLKILPWIPLAKLPTPVQKLKGLENELNFEGLYIKRDDLSHDVYGGNKCRKYEYVLADAIRKDRKYILTLGGIGTNHGVAQAVFCRELGLKSIVFVFDQPLTEHVRYNLLLEKYYGSELIYHPSIGGTAISLLWNYLTRERTYFVWAGASVPLGTLGFVNAAFELKNQVEEGKVPEPDYIFVADGSTGTSAGLTLGCELAGLKTQIRAVAVSDLFITKKSSVIKLVMKTLKLMRKYDKSVPAVSRDRLEKRLEVLTDFFGGRYGLPTLEGKEAVDLLKKTDNIKLDLTYTGKTMSAMLATVREKRKEVEGKVLMFWNTFNSVDHSPEAATIDYRSLPKKLHKFFDGTIKPVDTYVKARTNPDDIT